MSDSLYVERKEIGDVVYLEVAGGTGTELSVS